MLLDKNSQKVIDLIQKYDNLSNIENYVYEVKLPKENKQIIKHIKDYL